MRIDGGMRVLAPGLRRGNDTLVQFRRRRFRTEIGGHSLIDAHPGQKVAPERKYFCDRSAKTCLNSRLPDRLGHSLPLSVRERLERKKRKNMGTPDNPKRREEQIDH